MRNRRLTRLFARGKQRTLIVPLDHGLAQGPLDGLRDVPSLVRLLAEAEVDAVVLNPGVAAASGDALAQHPDLGLIVHLSVGSGLALQCHRRSVAGSVEHAIRLGADAVSVHLNVGTGDDTPQLNELATVCERSHTLGMPLLAMMYLQGGSKRVQHLSQAARMADELGASMIKLPYPGSESALRAVVRSVHCPVVCAGGSLADGPSVLDIADGVLRAGAAGLAVGRHVFQHAHPSSMARLLARVVHGRLRVEQARIQCASWSEDGLRLRIASEA